MLGSSLSLGERSPIAPWRALAAAALLLSPSLAWAEAAPPAPQPPRVTRVDLQRHDLSIPGHEAIQARVDFERGADAPRHTHPGEEIIYVLKGSIAYQVEGKPPVTLKAGDVLFIPAGTIHSARNVGGDSASELATYVVEKGKPLITQVK